MAASCLKTRQTGDRPVVLGVETIGRDQHIVDEWWRREIDEEEFRQRIRFDLDWGYDWAPFTNCWSPRANTVRPSTGWTACRAKICARSVPATAMPPKVAEIRQRHPKAVVLVLFGESHLAPDHLPRA